MSKPASTDLFNLIKSLSKTEKGYIKKSAFNKDDANFIKLFNAIDRQIEYDEVAILKNEPYIKQLPRLKIYLYERILDTLDDYYSAHNIDLLIRRILNRVFILFEKGFYDQCIKQLRKAKDLASRNERFSQSLEVLEWERTLMIEQQFVENFERIAKEETIILDSISNLSLYKEAYTQMTKLYAEMIFIRTEEEHKKFKKIIGQEIFKNESKAKSLQAKILYYKTIDKYYAAQDDRKRYMQYSQKALDLVEKNPVYIHQNITQYIKLLNNHITILSENKKYDDFWKYFNKLKNLPHNYSKANTEKVKNLISVRCVLREFYHYINLKDFDKVVEISKDLEKLLKKNFNLTSTTHHVFFVYQIAYMHFILGDYKKSLDLTNKIINSPVTPDKLFFHGFARLLNMIVHVEMGNSDLLQYLIKSNENFYKRHNKMYSLEKIVLDFLKNYVRNNVHEKMNSIKLFTDFKKSLEKNLDSLDLKTFEYFDFASWAESKMDGRTFKQTLQAY